MKALGRTTLALLLGLTVTAPAYADVTCGDGTTSEGGRGACSHHGGIAKRDTDKKADTEKPERADTESPVRTRSHKAPADTDRRRDADTARRRDTDTDTDTDRQAEPDRDTDERQSAEPAAHQAGAATARCRDGHLSYSKHHAGTCSGHHGVAKWLND